MPNCGTMTGKSTPTIFDALHIKLKKIGIEIKQLQILVTFQTLQFDPKFPLPIVDFLSKTCLEDDGDYSTNPRRATRTIITQLFFPNRKNLLL